MADTPFDNATLTKLMGTYGASPSAENMNRAREFFASNPEAAQRRAMGMRGSIQEDNTDVLGPMLDKLIADTSAPEPKGVVTVGEPTLDTVQNSTTPTRKTATAAPVATVSGKPNGPYRPGDGAVNEIDTSMQPRSIWDDLWKVIGGVTAAGALSRAPRDSTSGKPVPGLPAERALPEATYVGPMGRNEAPRPRRSGDIEAPGTADARGRTPSNSNSPIGADTNGGLPNAQGKIADRTLNGNVEDIGNSLESINNSKTATKTGKTAVMKDEIATENERAANLEEQMAKRLRDEDATRKLLKQGNKALGRRG